MGDLSGRVYKVDTQLVSSFVVRRLLCLNSKKSRSGSTNTTEFVSTFWFCEMANATEVSSEASSVSVVDRSNESSTSATTNANRNSSNGNGAHSSDNENGVNLDNSEVESDLLLEQVLWLIKMHVFNLFYVNFYIVSCSMHTSAEISWRWENH